jgi:hypothetical protein
MQKAQHDQGVPWSSLCERILELDDAVIHASIVGPLGDVKGSALKRTLSSAEIRKLEPPAELKANYGTIAG